MAKNWQKRAEATAREKDTNQNWPGREAVRDLNVIPCVRFLLRLPALPVKIAEKHAFPSERAQASGQVWQDV